MALRREILQAIEEGYTFFISGFGQGVDLLFAALVVEQKRQKPHLFLEAALPYAGRAKTKDELFHALLGQCNGIRIVCSDYAPGCFIRRNQYMVLRAQRVIAVYDGRKNGAVLRTLHYAQEQGREVRVINA